jgi:hypothetical protein
MSNNRYLFTKKDFENNDLNFVLSITDLKNINLHKNKTKKNKTITIMVSEAIHYS